MPLVNYVITGVLIGICSWALYRYLMADFEEQERGCECFHGLDDHPPIQLGSHYKNTVNPAIIRPCTICRCADYRPPKRRRTSWRDLE